MSLLCEDCGAHATWGLTSVREEVVPPDSSTTGACDGHRLDVTERMLVAHGNVTIEEVLG
jgi:hypothetical protein